LGVVVVGVGVGGLFFWWGCVLCVGGGVCFIVGLLFVLGFFWGGGGVT